MFNYTSLVAVVTPTDSLKSVRNLCENNVLVAFFCIFNLLFLILCWYKLRLLSYA